MSRALIVAYTNYVHDGRVKRHAEALAARGDSVDVICLDRVGQLNGVNIVGLDIPRYRGASKSSYLSNYIRFFIKAAAIATRRGIRQKYDVVIACTMPDAVVLCAVPLRLMGSRVVLDVHDTMPELYRDKFGGRRGALGARLLMIEERVSAALADRVLAVHEPHRQRLVQSGISPSKIHVVMNSPDSRIFGSCPRTNQPDGNFTVVCHGTLARRLGLDVAIKAVAILKERIPRLRLRIVGEGDYRREAKNLVTALRLEQMVTFEDPVPIEQLPALLAHAAVGLVPNRASSATHLMLPVKLMEYASLGIPSIAARLDTIERYFGEDAVRYFEPDNEASLAEAILDLYGRPELWRCLALRGRAVACQVSWPTQRSHFYHAIDSLLGAPRVQGWEDSPGYRESPKSDHLQQNGHVSD